MPTLQQLFLSMRLATERWAGAAGTDSGGSGSAGCAAPTSSQGRSTGGPLLCCFTDFNAEAVHRARQLCEHLLAACGGGASGDACVELETGLHPFRQPAAVLAADHALPSASNGFALWLTTGPRGN